MTEMLCPSCNAWTRVLETRQRPENSVYRRYECANTHRFVTMEQVTKVIPQKNAKPQ